MATPPVSGAPVTTTTRKRLPSIPTTEAASSPSPRATDPTRLLKPRGPLSLEYALLAEYKQVEKQKLPGVYIVPSAKSPLCWNGVLFIRQGFYQGGVFKFHLHIPDDYPDGDCPRLMFEQPVFHPLIDPESGELDVRRAFMKWRRNVNHLWQVLLYARRVFYKIDTKTPLNPEAAVLYEQEIDIYKTKVSEAVRRCQERLYDAPASDDLHAIRFSRLDPDTFESVKQQMKDLKNPPSSDLTKNAHTSGLSWMSNDTLDVFSSPNSTGAST